MDFAAMFLGAMTPAEVGVLGLAAFLTSILSAILGMGGGITLLALMLLFLEPLVAIPLHATVQLVSNGTRSLAQRRHIQWGILGLYALPLLPLDLPQNSPQAFRKSYPRGPCISGPPSD